EGIARARVTRYVPSSDCLRAVVEPMSPLTLDSSPDAEAHLRRAITLFEEYVAVHRRLPSELVSLIQSSDSPARQTFGIAAHLGTRLDRRQGLLEAPDFATLLRTLGETLKS